SGGGAAPKRVDFSYNALGQFSQISRYADLAGTSLVASSASGYDGANRLTGLTHQRGASTLAAYTWGYDRADRITSQTSPDGASTPSYAAAGQETAATHANAPNEAYGYAPAGNRTTPGYQTGAGNPLLADGRYSYAYDNEGNRLRRTDT